MQSIRPNDTKTLFIRSTVTMKHTKFSSQIACHLYKPKRPPNRNTFTLISNFHMHKFYLNEYFLDLFLLHCLRIILFVQFPVNSDAVIGYSTNLIQWNVHLIADKWNFFSRHKSNDERRSHIYLCLVFASNLYSSHYCCDLTVCTENETVRERGKKTFFVRNLYS